MYGEPSHVVSGVREGDVIAGKYRVERVLGVGGMGVVVSARHLQLEETVALKFLLPDALGNADAVARFVREARAAVRIKSEHVARVTDVGTLENGAPYMVMEYLEGGDLAGWLQQRGALPVEQAVEFVLQASVAVADAHALGIIHRDLKPANLFCVRRSDGELSIKVLDFGISKLTGTARGSQPTVSVTKTSAMVGSPLYMSPEQMQSSKTVDARADIWALGVVLFELIAGRPPFLSDSLPDLVLQIANEPAPSLRAFRADVSVGLEAVILKCIEKDPRQRYSNVGELARALLPFAPSGARGSVDRISRIIHTAGLSTNALAVPASAQAGDTQMLLSGTLQPMGRTVGGRRARTVAIGAGVAGALALAACVAFVVLHRPTVPAPHEEPKAAANTAPPSTASEASTDQSPNDVAARTATPTATPTPTATATPTPKPVMAAPTKPTAAPMAKHHAVDCSIPFTIDSQGHHLPKPECL